MSAVDRTTVMDGNAATSAGVNQSFSSVFNSASSVVGGGTSSDRMAKRFKSIQDSVGTLIGTRAAVLPGASRNLDLYQGYPHAMTGLGYAIQGTATVINTEVSEYLATFQDPIKVVFGTSIHREAKVIVTRKYAVGGRALITPEHAPARTVAVQEDAREIMMERYGGDIEMNLNLFMRPEEAQEELKLKVDAQKRELERVLIEKGYAAIMEQGTDLVDAIIRCNPAYNSQTMDAKELRKAAERVNITSVFGAMSKNAFPVMSLLAAAKYASAYTTASRKGSVLILPHGTHELLNFTRAEKLTYSIAGPGVLASNGGKPISMDVENAYEDPTTSCRVMVHRPLPDFDSGAAFPDVSAGGLTDRVKIGIFYEVGADEGIMDYGGRKIAKVDPGIYYRVMEVMMSSAVLAAPGSDTGELLVGYPFTSVSTSSSEQVKIQLRVYLAAVLKRPEAVIVMRNVHFEGPVSKYGVEIGTEGDIIKLNINHFDDQITTKRADSVDLRDLVNKDENRNFNKYLGNPFTADSGKFTALDESYGGPTIFYRGSTFSTKDDQSYGTKKQSNTGHLGDLDCPDKCERLWGSFAYNGMGHTFGK